MVLYIQQGSLTLADMGWREVVTPEAVALDVQTQDSHDDVGLSWHNLKFPIDAQVILADGHTIALWQAACRPVCLDDLWLQSSLRAEIHSNGCIGLSKTATSVLTRVTRPSSTVWGSTLSKRHNL